MGTFTSRGLRNLLILTIQFQIHQNRLVPLHLLVLPLSHNSGRYTTTVITKRSISKQANIKKTEYKQMFLVKTSKAFFDQKQKKVKVFSIAAIYHGLPPKYKPNRQTITGIIPVLYLLLMPFLIFLSVWQTDQSSQLFPPFIIDLLTCQHANNCFIQSIVWLFITNTIGPFTQILDQEQANSRPIKLPNQCQVSVNQKKSNKNKHNKQYCI